MYKYIKGEAMISFIVNKIFAGKIRSEIAPYGFIAISIFAVISTVVYFGMLDTVPFLVRTVITLLMYITFVGLERSNLRTTHVAFLSPFIMVALLTLGAVYFDGDVLLFELTIAGAMFSLAYMRPKGLLWYALGIGALQGVFLFVFDFNLVGGNLSQTFSYVAVVVINVTIYYFCRAYAKAARAKDVFLSHVSHEIRTPISAVLGMSEIRLKDEDLTPAQEESFSRIYNQSNLLLRIINDILDFSKLQAGKMPILAKEYKLLTLLNSVIHPHYTNTDIDFKFDIDPNAPRTLIGDTMRIQQVLVNLLSNAFKYTQAGHVKLTLVAERKSQTLLHFTIEDTGIGMTDTQLKDIYTSYTRFNESMKGNAAGTGLGMCIVQKLVHLMGGSIHIVSELGKGTTIHITIPQTPVGDSVLGEAVAKSIGEAQVEKPPTPEAKKAALDVLVVDDLEMNLFVTRGLLELHGINVDTCESGQEAINKARAGKVYDIIFMDSMMPNMSGTQALHSLRDIGYTAPVVVLTADAIAGAKEKYLQSGFDGFLSKPIDRALLLEVLQGVGR